MTCPFCKAAPRSDWGYECGTGPDANKQRSVRCREGEIATLRDRIKLLAHELESVGVQCGIAVTNEAIATNENHKLKQRISRLEQLGDALADAIDESCDPTHANDVTRWRRNKEPKP